MLLACCGGGTKSFGRRNNRTWGSGAVMSNVQELIDQHAISHTVDLIVLPTETLCYADASPFWLGEQSKRARFLIEKVFGDEPKELLGKNYVAVFICIVGVSIRIVNPEAVVNAFLQGNSGRLLLNIFFKFLLRLRSVCSEAHNV